MFQIRTSCPYDNNYYMLVDNRIIIITMILFNISGN